MLVGYARVSTSDQSLDLQTDALTAAGCERIYTDEASGAAPDRPGLAQALEVVRDGDTLVVWRLDRMGRTLSHLVKTVDDLAARGVAFRSLTEGMDTTGSMGRLLLHVVGAFAQFERDVIRERTRAGIESARARGKMGGPKPKMSPAKVELASRMMSDPKTSIAQVCEAVGVSDSTLYRYVGPDGTIRQMPKSRS